MTNNLGMLGLVGEDASCTLNQQALVTRDIVVQVVDIHKVSGAGGKNGGADSSSLCDRSPSSLLLIC